MTPDTPIARFLFSGHCTATRVRENAFLPPPNLRLSVVVADGLDETAAKGIAELHLESQERRCKGYAELKAVAFSEETLSINRDDVPFFRHANVEGWPPDKPHQKAIAQRLAHKAKLHLFS